ncbi:hypothetical protein CAEBREN_31002 [Caenorhabditis brenneri]|uniref:Sdz-33 F-box domain-containing protein n=1 Tax=Caenorhabditis brenneri TaxID=135651 RepID=G0P3A9_CAEBE|nr:hypothetical protein CAEBREN_31002 [Caenorhabditis brenneri]
MDVVAFIFPLLSLKPEIVAFIIKCMDEIDIVTFSLISRGTKNLVESIGFTATDITLTFEEGAELGIEFRADKLLIYLTEWNEEWREGIDDPYDMTPADVVYVTLLHGYGAAHYKVPHFQVRDWIEHFLFIFHKRFIDCFDLGLSGCKFTFDSISREISRNSVRHLVLPYGQNHAYGKQLINYFLTPRITISPDEFPERDSFLRVLVQNLDLVRFNGGGDLTLDDLLITNSKAICIYQGQTMTMKTINRFIKLWQPGSNPRLECFVIHLNEVWLPQDLFKGITYTEMNDEIEVEFDKRDDYGLLDSNRVENSPKTVVLPVMEISPLQSISGYKLKSKECQDLKLIVGGKMMITHNLKMEMLANILMARLLQETREFLVLKR